MPHFLLDQEYYKSQEIGYHQLVLHLAPHVLNVKICVFDASQVISLLLSLIFYYSLQRQIWTILLPLYLLTHGDNNNWPCNNTDLG